MKNSSRDLSSLYNPEQTLLRSFSDLIKEYESAKILYRGLVMEVDRYGTDFRPRFSIKAKVIGVDDPYDNSVKNLKYFPPLFPIHMMALPEVGEEVLIICEEISNLN